MKSILLHVCCGPCAAIPLGILAHRSLRFAAFFSNSNIHPKAEYCQRLDTFKALANDEAVVVAQDDYDPLAWYAAISGSEGVFPLIHGSENYAINLKAKTLRCRKCYGYRFDKLAQAAVSMGFDSIGTTLSISPYQFNIDMDEVLQNSASKYGLISAFEDYRQYYAESVCKSKTLGMYRQNYCGCMFSQIEADLERGARKSRPKNFRKVNK